MCEDEGWSLLAAGAATGAKLHFGCEAGGPGAGPEPQPVAPYSACWCHTEPRQVDLQTCHLIFRPDKSLTAEHRAADRKVHFTRFTLSCALRLFPFKIQMRVDAE